MERRYPDRHDVRLTMRAGAGAAVGVVAELMDMYASLRRRIIAGDIIGDGRGRGFGRLLKGDGTTDGGVTTKDCDCSQRNSKSAEGLESMEM